MKMEKTEPELNFGIFFFEKMLHADSFSARFATIIKFFVTPLISYVYAECGYTRNQMILKTHFKNTHDLNRSVTRQ